jgi:hypothetical protein
LRLSGQALFTFLTIFPQMQASIVSARCYYT